MLATRRFLVSGRVQGVGYRMFVHEAALFEHVNGWVRNRSDGRVEALAQGPHAAMQRFEEQVRLGPPRARVDVVEVTEAPGEGPFSGFRIESD
jgi:acylphosphatase